MNALENYRETTKWYELGGGDGPDGGDWRECADDLAKEVEALRASLIAATSSAAPLHVHNCDEDCCALVGRIGNADIYARSDGGIVVRYSSEPSDYESGVDCPDETYGRNVVERILHRAFTRAIRESSKGQTQVRIEDCRPGDRLDMGVFAGIDPRDPKQGPNTVNVRLANGYHYTETAGALVTVWNR